MRWGEKIRSRKLTAYMCSHSAPVPEARVEFNADLGQVSLRLTTYYCIPHLLPSPCFFSCSHTILMSSKPRHSSSAFTPNTSKLPKFLQSKQTLNRSCFMVDPASGSLNIPNIIKIPHCTLATRILCGFYATCLDHMSFPLSPPFETRWLSPSSVDRPKLLQLQLPWSRYQSLSSKHWWPGGEKGWMSDAGWDTANRSVVTCDGTRTSTPSAMYVRSPFSNTYLIGLSEDRQHPPHLMYTTDYTTYVQILSWFFDSPSTLCPFSVHRMVLAGKELGKDVWQWFELSTAAGTIKCMDVAIVSALMLTLC